MVTVQTSSTTPKFCWISNRNWRHTWGTGRSYLHYYCDYILQIFHLTFWLVDCPRIYLSGNCLMSRINLCVCCFSVCVITHFCTFCWLVKLLVVCKWESLLTFVTIWQEYVVNRTCKSENARDVEKNYCYVVRIHAHWWCCWWEKRSLLFHFSSWWQGMLHDYASSESTRMYSVWNDIWSCSSQGTWYVRVFTTLHLDPLIQMWNDDLMGEWVSDWVCWVYCHSWHNVGNFGGGG